MSIFSSLYIGMSGMRSNEGAIGVIGNNIANLNTIGYKSSRAVFADLLSQNMLGTAGMSQAGQGAALAAVQRMVGQGALLGTGATSDMAVDGEGYFLVENAGNDRFYTRNGQFQLDADGYLTTVEGLRLQGYPADATGVVGTALGDLQVQNATARPQATTSVSMTLNLDATDPISTFLPGTPGAAGSSSFRTNVTVYDSLGVAHQLDVFFSKTAAGTWEWHAMSPTGETDGTNSTAPVEVASGTLEFDNTGTLTAVTDNTTSVTYNGAATQILDFDFGDPANPGLGSNSTSNGGPSALSAVDQDGFAAGQLAFIEVTGDGEIQGTFSNGEQRTLGQVALARFQAPAELNSIGQNLFTQTLASGEPAIGAANTGGRGAIASGSLEQSNVDLTAEFTQLILAQRGYQASSRTITTADEMLVEAVNLKR